VIEVCVDVKDAVRQEALKGAIQEGAIFGSEFGDELHGTIING
jgi:hypothetical protein